MLSPADLVSMAKYICLVKRREIGPTAKATEMIEPAILANSRNEQIGRNFFELSAAKVVKLKFTDILTHVNLVVSDAGK